MHLDPRMPELYRLIVARSDILAAHTVASYAADEVSDIRHPLWIPLQEVSIVSYARPFTANRPYGPLPSEWGLFDNPREQTLHDDLIESRNRLVAHSDAGMRKVTVIPPGFEFTRGRQAGALGGIGISATRYSPEHFSDIADLCLTLGRRLNTAIEGIREALFQDHKLPDYPFDLRTGERVEMGPDEADEQRDLE